MPSFPLPIVAAPAKNIRQKLYYLIDIATSHALVPTTFVQAFRFIAGTGPGFGTVDPDCYGGVMEPNQFNGVMPATDLSLKMSARQAISARFQCASSLNGSVNGGDTPVKSDECVDFIAETGDPLLLPGIDPVTVRRPRVRFKFFAGSGARIQGVLYLGRNHAGAEV